MAAFSCRDGHVHALYSDGVEAWEQNLGEPLAGPLVVGDKYRIFGPTVRVALRSNWAALVNCGKLLAQDQNQC